MLAMLFAVCAFVTTAFAENESTTTTTTTTEATTEDKDAPQDGFNETTTTTKKADDTTTTTTEKADDATTTTTKKADDTTTSTTELIGTLAPGQTAYEGQGDEDGIGAAVEQKGRKKGGAYTAQDCGGARWEVLCDPHTDVVPGGGEVERCHKPNAEIEEDARHRRHDARKERGQARGHGGERRLQKIDQ